MKKTIEFDELDYSENIVVKKRINVDSCKMSGSKLLAIHRVLFTFIAIFVFAIGYFFMVSTNVDESQIRYNENAYVLNKKVHNNGEKNFMSKEKFLTNLANGQIASLTEEKIYDFSLFSNQLVKSSSVKALYVPFEFNSNDVIYGDNIISKSNEVIVSRKIADSLRGSIALADFVGYGISIDSSASNLIVVGITDSPLYEVFYSIEKYTLKGQYINIGTGDAYCNVVKKYDEDINIVSGTLPTSKNEILALDDGKRSVGDKAGSFIIAGLYTYQKMLIGNMSTSYLLMLFLIRILLAQ